MRRSLAILLALALLTSLTGCVRNPSPAQVVQPVELPEPEPREPELMLGEKIISDPENVTLYYTAGDGSSFTTLIRGLSTTSDESLLDRAMSALLRSNLSRDLLANLPADTTFLEVEFACGIATVRLSLDAYNAVNEQQMLALIVCVSNTLLSLEGVEAVNVLVGNSPISVATLPIGVQTETLSAIAPAFAQLNAEYDYFLQGQTGTIERTAVLYFPASDGEWLVPELRLLSFDSANYAAALIRALRDGPKEHSGAIAIIPESTDLLMSNPAVAVEPSGECVLTLDFSSTLRSYLALSGLEEWKMLGSIVLTVCSFIPEIDAVRIFIGGEPVDHCYVHGEERSFDGGLLHRQDFSDRVGSIVWLDIPTDEKAIMRFPFAIARISALSPLHRLYAFMDATVASQNTSSFVPEGVYYADILGVSVEDSIATVNLSANFYRQAQRLSTDDERLLVYAMINTLCEFESISGVRFLVEGRVSETLSGGISLRDILLPNPGIVQEPTPVPDALQEE